MKEINVTDFLGNPQLYRHMPVLVFDSLIAAYLRCDDTITILEEDYDKILNQD